MGELKAAARLRDPLVAVLAAAALACAHGRRIIENFRATHWEDTLFFRSTEAHLHTLWDCFRLPGPYPGLYRPLTTNLFYFLGRAAFGDDVAAYHLVCLALVVGNAVLLYRIAFRLLPSPWALLAPVAFASRLANVEIVTHTCEFQSLFSVFWALLSIDWFLAGRLRWSALAFSFALASKETALVVPALLFIHQSALARPIRFRPLGGHLAIAALWIVVLLAFHHRPTGFHYDFSPTNVFGNLAAYLLGFSNLVVWPLDDWVMPSPLRAAANTRVAAVVMLVLTTLDLVALVRVPRARLLAFGFAWFLIASLPAAVFEGRLFMRYGYFGYAGLSLCCCALGALASDFVRGRRGGRASRAAA